eukprot:SAG31_NODE_3300_length_4443_cov_3.762431_2_plen_307_part_00
MEMYCYRCGARPLQATPTCHKCDFFLEFIILRVSIDDAPQPISEGRKGGVEAPSVSTGDKSKLVGSLGRRVKAARQHARRSSNPSLFAIDTAETEQNFAAELMRGNIEARASELADEVKTHIANLRDMLLKREALLLEEINHTKVALLDELEAAPSGACIDVDFRCVLGPAVSALRGKIEALNFERGVIRNDAARSSQQQPGQPTQEDQSQVNLTRYVAQSLVASWAVQEDGPADGGTSPTITYSPSKQYVRLRRAAIQNFAVTPKRKARGDRLRRASAPNVAAVVGSSPTLWKDFGIGPRGGVAS